MVHQCTLAQKALHPSTRMGGGWGCRFKTHWVCHVCNLRINKKCSISCMHCLPLVFRDGVKKRVILLDLRGLASLFHFFLALNDSYYCQWWCVVSAFCMCLMYMDCFPWVTWSSYVLNCIHNSVADALVLHVSLVTRWAKLSVFKGFILCVLFWFLVVLTLPVILISH